MAVPWNLSTEQWSDVLLRGATPEHLASTLERGSSLPWTDVVLKYTDESEKILDLGSGRGELSAALALNNRRATLLDWSEDNISFSSSLFRGLGISGDFCRADMTKPLPFKDGSFDAVFSCGVFEYFREQEISAILKEAFRIARRRVIILVPNAASVAYRIGKWYMEKTGAWPWGGEVPSYTLKPYFRRLGCMEVVEFSVGAKHSLAFLKMPAGAIIRALCTRVLRVRDHSRPALLRQGYLLITIGEKTASSRR